VEFALILMYRYWRLYKNVSLLCIHLNLALALLVSLILFVATVDVVQKYHVCWHDLMSSIVHYIHVIG